MTPLLLTIPLIAAAPVPKDFKPTSHWATLQGEWVEVERVSKGVLQPHRGTRYLIEGDRVRLINTSGVSEVKLTLDEKTRTYIWVVPWGTWIGRYRLEGDTLTRVSVTDDEALPGEIAAGPTVQYIVSKRIKK